MNDNTFKERYAHICAKALRYNAEAEKYYNRLLKEIASTSSKKDTARIKMHYTNICGIYESIRSHVVSIQISDIKRLKHIQKFNSEIVLKGAENLLSTIALQTAALAGAIGMTKYIPNRF